MIHLKIEKVKEMLMLYDMTLTQIAYKLNYSSLAHLSSQFKKVTGMPATKFKNQKLYKRKTIQDL
jgi:AraC-like DNA-binding protein